MAECRIEELKILEQLSMLFAAWTQVEDEHEALGIAVEPQEAQQDALQTQASAHGQQPIFFKQVSKGILVKSK